MRTYIWLLLFLQSLSGVTVASAQTCEDPWFIPQSRPPGPRLVHQEIRLEGSGCPPRSSFCPRAEIFENGTDRVVGFSFAFGDEYVLSFNPLAEQSRNCVIKFVLESPVPTTYAFLSGEFEGIAQIEQGDDAQIDMAMGMVDMPGMEPIYESARQHIPGPYPPPGGGPAWALRPQVQNIRWSPCETRRSFIVYTSATLRARSARSLLSFNFAHFSVNAQNAASSVAIAAHACSQ